MRRRGEVMTPVTILGAMGGDRNPQACAGALRDGCVAVTRCRHVGTRRHVVAVVRQNPRGRSSVPASVRGTAVATGAGVRRAMLRITNGTRREGTTLVLEGRLTGPWVDELARCWQALTATQDARTVAVDLDAVTFIDAGGRALLRTMHEAGAALEVCSGCMTRAIVEEITQR